MTEQQKKIVRDYITDIINDFDYRNFDCLFEESEDVFTPADIDKAVEYITKLKVIEK